MNIVMNILWIVLGGLFICIEYIIASLLLMVTIIGIPFGLQTLKLSVLALCPFGMQVRSCPGGEGCLGVSFDMGNGKSDFVILNLSSTGSVGANSATYPTTRTFNFGVKVTIK